LHRQIEWCTLITNNSLMGSAVFEAWGAIWDRHNLGQARSGTGNAVARQAKQMASLAGAAAQAVFIALTGGVFNPVCAQVDGSGWTTSAAPTLPRTVLPSTVPRSRTVPQPATAPLTPLPDNANPDTSSLDPDILAAMAAKAVQFEASGTPKATKPLSEKRPVIVIDPGHGGVDPGAVGPSIAGSPPVLEKTVVLAVSKLLASALLAGGRYEVVLTRSGDTFVPLDQRLTQSRRSGADLFISIHADSVAANANAQGVRGATVYTLSDHASDEQARRLADKENAADQAGGLAVAAKLDNDLVRNILVDLMRRETAEFSAEFRGTVVAELSRRIAMAREPQRAAAFKVLKQTDVPAVLVELGYMSNAQDQKLLQSAAWQSQVAASIALAVDSFFDRRDRATVAGAATGKKPMAD
jgi:N-acetylmuramoyl-L-alanine amidase